MSTKGGDTSPSSEDESSWSFEQPDREEYNEAVCLFCDLMLESVKNAIAHCKLDHQFDIFVVRDKFKLDYYSYIKLINYIRLEKPDVKTVTDSEVALWLDDKYLKPTDINDSWLWYDLEGLYEKTEQEKAPKYVNSENGNVTMSADHFSELQETILRLTEEVKEKNVQLLRLKEIESALENEQLPGISVSGLKLDEDSQYFSSYSSPSIHWEMLKDEVRTRSYQNAITANKNLFHGKTVLDLGSGTGILSLMAASTGARKVIGVEESDILYNSMDIVRENNLDQVIDLVKGKLEDVTLPVSDKVDIIISEWMGYFLLFEGMLDSVIYARKKYLKPGGTILPTKCQLYLVGASNTDLHNSYVSFWNNVYGYDMNAIKTLFLREGIVETVTQDKVLTDPFLILEINTETCEVEDTVFKSQFFLKSNRDGELTHIVGYFDTFFELEIPSSFTTGPRGPPTHWKQTSFFLDDPITLRTGEVIQGEIECCRNPQHTRSLVINIEIQGQPSKSYYIS